MRSSPQLKRSIETLHDIVTYDAALGEDIVTHDIAPMMMTFHNLLQQALGKPSQKMVKLGEKSKQGGRKVKSTQPNSQSLNSIFKKAVMHQSMEKFNLTIKIG